VFILLTLGFQDSGCLIYFVVCPSVNFEGAGALVGLLFSFTNTSDDLLATGAKYAEANAETEKLWNAFFSDPDHWWDNRATKVKSCVQNDSSSLIKPCLKCWRQSELIGRVPFFRDHYCV
jgi:hypothetical protein